MNDRQNILTRYNELYMIHIVIFGTVVTMWYFIVFHLDFLKTKNASQKNPTIIKADQNRKKYQEKKSLQNYHCILSKRTILNN